MCNPPAMSKKLESQPQYSECNKFSRNSTIVCWVTRITTKLHQPIVFFSERNKWSRIVTYYAGNRPACDYQVNMLAWQASGYGNIHDFSMVWSTLDRHSLTWPIANRASSHMTNREPVHEPCIVKSLEKFRQAYNRMAIQCDQGRVLQQKPLLVACHYAKNGDIVTAMCRS